MTDTPAKMPERIWAAWGGFFWLYDHGDPSRTEYVRADIVADAMDAATALGFERGKEAAASTQTRAMEALAEAEKALKEAREAVGGWAAYAGDYFREKHGLEDDLAAIDAALVSIATAKGEKP